MRDCLRGPTGIGRDYRMWTRPRRAAEMVGATRWLFFMAALVSLLLALLAPLLAADSTALLVALASTVVLGLSWSAGYSHASAPLVMDVIDAMAILAFALACPEPAAAFGFVFFALWFRSLYGSTGRAVWRCGLYVGALSATLPLWPHVLGHTGGAQIGPLTGAFPTMFLTVIVSRYLAGSLQAREQAARLDVMNASTGSQLMGVTDLAEIDRIAWAAIAGICAVTPGLRVLKVVREGAGLRVDGATGGFAHLPATLPATALSINGGDSFAGRGKAHSCTELDAAAGAPCVWGCVPIPEVHNQDGGPWLLLGSPGKVPTEAIATIGALANQVTLSLSNGEALQKLTAQARLDSLTGLVNRAAFNAGLSAALDEESACNTTVLFIDLDDFKHVNDVFGHGAGDELLQEVAARLCRVTRPQDLCARLGGDEFAVLLRSTGEAAAAEIAQRVVQAIAVPVLVDGGVAHISASVGVATATGQRDLEQLLHHADVAMYTAKTTGKARIQIFEPNLLNNDSSRCSPSEHH
jgi:diguanylate cyclase (GGDEF)-like protein